MPDIFQPQGPASQEVEAPSLKSKLLWFVVLSVGGVTVVAGVAYFLRALLFI